MMSNILLLVREVSDYIRFAELHPWLEDESLRGRDFDRDGSLPGKNSIHAFKIAPLEPLSGNVSTSMCPSRVFPSFSEMTCVAGGNFESIASLLALHTPHVRICKNLCNRRTVTQVSRRFIVYMGY